MLLDKMDAILRKIGGTTGETNYLLITSIISILVLYLNSSMESVLPQSPPMLCLKKKYDQRFDDGQVLGQFCHSSFSLTPDYDFNSTLTKQFQNGSLTNYDFLK